MIANSQVNGSIISYVLIFSFSDQRILLKWSMLSQKNPRNFVPCYVCGRLYAQHSLKFHIPKCLEKWQSENDQKPVHLRQPTPVDPNQWREIFEDTYDLDAWRGPSKEDRWMLFFSSFRKYAKLRKYMKQLYQSLCVKINAIDSTACSWHTQSD